jgi:hypothetical protein
MQQAHAQQQQQHQHHMQQQSMQLQQGFMYNSQNLAQNMSLPPVQLTPPHQNMSQTPQQQHQPRQPQQQQQQQQPPSSAGKQNKKMPSGILNPMYAKADFNLPQHPYQDVYVAPSSGYGHPQGGVWWGS